MSRLGQSDGMKNCLTGEEDVVYLPVVQGSILAPAGIVLLYFFFTEKRGNYAPVIP